MHAGLPETRRPGRSDSALQTDGGAGLAEGLLLAARGPMNQPPPAYTDFHPRWYRPRISTYWWLDRRPYLAFILRELSSLFVAWAIVYLLFLVQALARGASSYREFLE